MYGMQYAKIGITGLSENLGKDDRMEEPLGTFCDAAQERNTCNLIIPTAYRRLEQLEKF